MRAILSAYYGLMILAALALVILALIVYGICVVPL